MRTRVGEADAGSRLDALVARLAGVSRAEAARLVAAGAVTVDGRPRPKAYRVSAGELVEAELSLRPPPAPPPPEVPVVYRNEHLVVVDKPPGVVVHPAPGLREGTVVDALRAAGIPLAPGGGPDRPGVVHRLDRDVSGLLLVACTDRALRALQAAIRERRVERVYLAAVAGVVEVDRGKVEAPIARHPRHRTRMAVLAEGRPAVTWFRVRERLGGATLLEVRLETGRTHQIRTHLASIGHPVLGDPAYGHDPGLARRVGLRRPFLHAFRLRLAHPVTGQPLAFERDLPPDLALVLGRLRA